jgi:uncharacterized protein DUF6519
MATIDVSRWATDFRKRYGGLRMQQGRVLTDDDFNEAERLDAEDTRVTRLHVIGESGSPDAGFSIQNLGPNAAGALTFQIAAGTLYLGGLRLENPAAESFELQKDWLPFVQLTDGIPAVPLNTTRTDLAWIEAWQQNISAVEDSEIFEKALGGPDSAERLRTMRRVHVTTGIADADCASAWTTLTAAWAAAGEGTLRPDLEIGTDATLTVSFAPGSGTPNLCSPPVAGGYLGAENQAIRVQLNGTNTFTWGFDNASTLYRALIKTDPDPASPTSGLRVVLEFQTEPRDTMHWPRVGQLIEILPWSAALPNKEKIAELSGMYGRVTKSYDPITRQIFIAPESGTQIPAGFDSVWQARPAADVATFYDGTAGSKYVYLRMWDRGDDILSPPRISIAAPPIPLGHTGLQVQFNGAPIRNNDFWIVAARPDTPDQLVPWILKAQAPPIGLKRYRAPLALIEWTNAAGVVTGTIVHDCRRPFLPLTKIKGCCTITVGDGTHSFGQYSTIQSAIAALPPDGGTICVLGGVYDESVVIDRRIAVRIHGCGSGSRVRAVTAAGGAALPAFTITNSSVVYLEDLAIESGPQSAVYMSNSRHVTIRHCLVQMRDVATLWPAIYSRGDDVTIEENVIEVLPRGGSVPAPHLPPLVGDPSAPAGVATPAPAITAGSATRGGIQLAGGSDRVRILRNNIRGGIWNGITLGSLHAVGSPPGDDTPDPPASEDPCNPCRPVDLSAPDPGGGGVRYESAGDLYDIEIAGNQITDMGICGIGIVRFFDLLKGGDLIGVHNLLIADNLITRCMRREISLATAAMQFLVAYGGISLASVTNLRILRNAIVSNGNSHVEPICGVFALFVQGFQLDENRIVGNGAKTTTAVSSAKAGIRGGVHVWFVLPPVPVGAPRTGEATCTMRDNVIVAPLGRAVTFFALGDVVVARNRLASQGCTQTGFDLLAATVLIGNFGISNEWTLGLIVMVILQMFGNTRPGSECRLAKLGGTFNGTTSRVTFWPPLVRDFASGKTLFAENQVTLDLMDEPLGFGLTSVAVFSLDDVGMTDNQCEIDTTQVFYFTNAMVVGGSVRESDNRFAETWMHAGFSAVSFGLLNTTTDNQSTHCLNATAMLPSMRMFKHNLSFVQAMCPSECGGTDGYGEDNPS